MIPIYTGKTEEELPSVLRDDTKGRYVDEAYPFIWKELHQKSKRHFKTISKKFQNSNFNSLLDWTSLYLDDCPEIGAFTYRMRGFKNHTPIHYLKNYQIKFVNLFIILKTLSFTKTKVLGPS